MTKGNGVNFYTLVNGFPGKSSASARAAEDNGWDGIWVPDSQNLTGDPYVALTMCAHATSHLLLKTGVTNPLTRHPAVTATSIATVQEESNGRAHLGIGRGDSSLAYLGMAPVPVSFLIAYVEKVQSYLRLERVPFDIEADALRGIKPVDSLGLGGAPTESQLRWLRHATVKTKVPVEIVASGPKMIQAGALVADKMTFAVGSDPVRVKWAIDTAMEARAASGLDLPPIEFGLLIGVAVHEDRATAHQMVSETFLSGLVRFSVMHGKPTGPVSDNVAESLSKVHSVYDMNKHGRPGTQVDEVDENLIETFSIAGPANYCVERVLALTELGIASMDLVSGWGVDTSTGAIAQESLTADVLPAVRDSLSTAAARK